MKAMLTINRISRLTGPIMIVASSTTLANAASFIVRLSFDQVYDRVLPFPKLTSTHVETEVTINNKGQVQSRIHKTTGKRNEFSFQVNATSSLGEDNRKEHWRVGGPNRLLNVKDYPSFRRAILVVFDKGKCTAQVDYELKAGFTDYRYDRDMDPNGPLAVAKSARADSLGCSISGW